MMDAPPSHIHASSLMPPLSSTFRGERLPLPTSLLLRSSTHPVKKSRFRLVKENTNLPNPVAQASSPKAVPPPFITARSMAASHLPPPPPLPTAGPQEPSSRPSTLHAPSQGPLDKNGKPVEISELRAKKSVQAFFRAFAECLEPTLRRSWSVSLMEQETNNRIHLKETVDEVLEEQKIRIGRELARKNYEDRLARYYAAVQEYRSKRHTTILLLMLEVMGVTLLSLLYSYEVLNGHLGAITSFILSAIYTIFMWRRNMMAAPRRPCPYDSIAGPPPDHGSDGEEVLPRSTWYERNLRWLPLPNRHTVKRAYGLFD